MNKKLKYQLLVALLVNCFACISQIQAQTTTSYTTPGADTWTCPAGVTSVTVTVWGGGGGGGGCNASSDGGGGGGGGGCSQSVLTVVPSTVYNLFVGAGGAGGVGQVDGSAGGQSWFNTAGTLQANGGSGGLQRTTSGGLGGAGATAGIGTTTNTGGNGRRGRDHPNGRGGGGGGGAGTTANGAGGLTTTFSVTGGAGGATGGGDGGDGDGDDGSPGVTLGGAGAGAGDGSPQTGGAGARGQVDIFIPVVGDDCSNAIALTVDAACVAGSTAGATTESGEVQPCGGAFDQSIWYSFVATATQHEVTIDNTIGGGACYNMYTAIYDGTGGCVPTTPIACISDNADPQIYNYGGFSIGVTYYVQVTFGSGLCTDQTFCIDVSTAAVCTGESTCSCGTLCIPVDGTCIEGSLNGAVNCLSSGCASLNPTANFAFKATSTTIDVSIDNLGTDWVAGEIDVRLYSGGCLVTNVATVCSAVPSFSNQFTGLTAGTMYSIWVSSSNGYNGANSEFGMCVTSGGSACSVGSCGNPPGPSGDAYGVHSPDALGGTISTCEIYATGGSTGTDGLVYANGGEVGTSVAISDYPVITAENISCLDTDIDYTATDPTPVWPSGALGANATIADPADAATVSNNQYTATGRKTITFEGDVGVPAQTFSSTVNTAIPEHLGCLGSVLTDDITVSGYSSNIATANMSVTVNITHTYVSDLRLLLQAPSGDILLLARNNGGSDNNFTNTVFSDGGVTNISAGTAPFTGIYQPLGTIAAQCGYNCNMATFSAFGGGTLNPNGTWTLITYDFATGDDGTLDDWSISFPAATTADQTVTYPDFVNMEMALPTAGTPTGSALICSGTTGSYASPDAGTLGYSYLWTTSTSGIQAAPVIGTATASSTDITFSNVSGGDLAYTIYLDITTECCGPLAQVSKAVTVSSIPLPDPIVLDAAPSVCAGGTATLSVNSPNASYNYEWYLGSSGGSAASTGSSYDVTATTTPTTYYVEAVTSNSCRSSPRVSVVLTGTDTPPTVPDPAAGCGPGLFTATVTSPVSGATYSWYNTAGPPPSGLLQTGLSTSYDINASSTPTLVYVTETAPGCDASTATTVTVSYTGTITVEWNGSSSSDWFTADNWNPKCVPDAGVDVTIPSALSVTNNCDIQFANGGDANCKSILIHPAGIFVMGDTKAVLNVHGDWTNHGIFTLVQGVVEFTGTAAQNILGTAVTLFYNLNINKSSGTVTMGVNLVVASNLNLLDGELDIDDNKITITNVSPSAVGNVDGYLVSEGQTSFLEWYTDATANTYVFPFGVSGSHIPFTFKKNAAVATDIVIATWHTDPTNQTMIPTGTTLDAGKGTSQLIDRWWEIAPSVALSADLTFRWTTSETSAVNYTGDPMSYHWNGTGWDDISGSAGLESITATWTSYSGGGGGGGPLPLGLWYFDAEHNAATGNVDLSWATVSETNSEFFTVEKSRGGKDFEFVATVPGAGTSKQAVNYSAVDEDPYMGLSYYRLKRTDFDDECKYSQLVPVTIMENLQFSVWPNPAKDKLEITFGNASKGTILPMSPENSAEINIYDSDGRLVYSKVFDGTFYKFSIDISMFDQGMYIVTLNANNDLHTAKFIKE